MQCAALAHNADSAVVLKKDDGASVCLHKAHSVSPQGFCHESNNHCI